jgi:hypothetical protein
MTFLTELDSAGPLIIGAAIGAIAFVVPYVRRRFHRWRLARRMRQDPYLLAEELREYELAIGEELPPVEPAGLALAAAFIGAAVAIPLWFAGTVLETLWDLEWLIAGVVAALFGLWRWLNDPPGLEPAAGRPRVEVPREAWLGLIGGIGITALTLLLIVALV